MALLNKTCEKDSKKQHSWLKKLNNLTIKVQKILFLKKKKIKMLKSGIIKWLLMSILTLSILDVLQEMILYWSGIDFCVEFMVVVEGLICFIKPTHQQVFIRHNKLLKKLLFKALTQMEKSALFIMHMIITFVQLGMNLFQRMIKEKKMELSLWMICQSKVMNST